MTVCPACENEIRELTFLDKKFLRLLENGEKIDLSDILDKESYFCPKCDALLFDNEKEALSFLFSGVKDETEISS